jgi:ABC-type transporter Mla subunit MlaD
MDQDGNYLHDAKTSTSSTPLKLFFNIPIDAEITGELDGIEFKKKINHPSPVKHYPETFEFPTQLKVVIVEKDPANDGKYRVVSKDDNVVYGQPCIEPSAGSIKNLGNKYDVSGKPHENYFYIDSGTNFLITFNNKDYEYKQHLIMGNDDVDNCKLGNTPFRRFSGNEENLNLPSFSEFKENKFGINQALFKKKYNYLVVLREENQQAKQQQQDIEKLKDTIKSLQTQLQSMPSNNQDILDKINQVNTSINTLLSKSNDLASKQQIEDLSKQTKKLTEKIENMIIKDYDTNFKELKELIKNNQNIPDDLLENLKKLTESVNSLTTDNNVSEHEKLFKKIEESEENIIESFKETLNQEISKLEKKIDNEEIKNKIKEAKAYLEEKLKNLSEVKDIHALAKQINTVKDELKNDINNIKFDVVTTKLDELNSTFTAIFTNIAVDIEDIKNKKLPDLKDNSEELNNLAKQVKEINDIITAFNSSLYSQGELTQQEISEIKGKINDLSTNFAQLSDNFNVISQEFKNLKSTIGSPVPKDYDKNFEKIEKQINELKDILNKFIKFLNMPSPPSNAPINPQGSMVSNNNFTIKGKILCLLPITGFNIKICKHTEDDTMGEILYGETKKIIVQDSLFECVIDKNINEDLDIWMGTKDDWAKYGIIRHPYNDLNDERFMEL